MDLGYVPFVKLKENGAIKMGRIRYDDPVKARKASRDMYEILKNDYDLIDEEFIMSTWSE